MTTRSCPQFASLLVLSAIFVSTSLRAQIGQFWRVGNSGTISRSCVAVGNGIYVAGNTSGNVEYSSDGVTWTQVASGISGSSNVAGVSRIGSTFFAVGGDEISRSTDGQSWTVGPLESNTFGRSIAGHASTLVVVGSSTSISTNNGISWTQPEALQYTYLNDVIRTATQYVAVGDSGTIFTSANGVAWTNRSLSEPSNLKAVAASPTMTVAVGGDLYSSQAVIYSSPNGIAWTKRPIGVGNEIVDVVWTGSRFIALCSREVALLSTDGINWTQRNTYLPLPSQSGLPSIISLAADGTRAVAVGTDGLVLTSDSRPIASFSSDTSIVSELAGAIDLGVSLSAPALAAFDLPILTGGTAVSGDFSVPSTLRFNQGESAKTVTVTLTNNSTVATSNPTLKLKLGSIPECGPGLFLEHEITILDDEYAPEVFFDCQLQAVTESDQKATFEVVLSQASASPLNVPLNITTGEGYALDSADFTGVPSSLTFSPGEIRKTVVLTLVDDSIEESKETIGLSFGDLTGVTASAGASTCVIEISDNDPNTELSKVWTLRQPLPGEARYSAAFANLNGVPTLLSVGEGSVAMRSTDGGLSWSRHRIMPTKNSFYKVIYQNGQFIAVGDFAIATSFDGMTWAIRKPRISSDYFYRDIVWTGTRYVVVGFIYGSTASAVITTSTDAVTWTTSQPLLLAGILSSVAWNGNSLVAVGSQSSGGAPPATIILRSSDGIAWEDRSSALLNKTLRDVLWAGNLGSPTTNDRFIALDGSKTCYTSPDGIRWTPQANKLLANASAGVWNGTQVLAVGAAISRSNNGTGTSWTQSTSGVSKALDEVIFDSAGGYIAMGEDSLLTSVNGTAWVKQNSGLSTYNSLTGVAWSGTRFVAIGGDVSGFNDNKVVIMTSTDGSSWQPVTTTAKGSLMGVAWSGTQFVAVGRQGLILTSTDGLAWTSRTSGVKLTLRDIIWTGNQFVAVGGEGEYWRTGLSSQLNESVILTSPNGTTWTRRILPSNSSLDSIAFDGTNFVAVGNAYYDSATFNRISTALTSSDGVTWSLGGQTGSANITHIATNGSRFVAVDENGNAVTSDDKGQTWTTSSTQPLVNGSTIYLETVIWTGTQFIAAGEGYVAESEDGDTWSTRPIGTNMSLWGLGYNGARLICVGDNAIIFSTGSATLPLPTLNFESAGMSFPEGNPTAQFRLTITPPATTRLTLSLPISASTLALTGSTADVSVPTPTTAFAVTVNPGESVKIISIPVRNDTLDEMDERMTFTLPSNAAYNLGGNASFTFNISDDDEAPTISALTNQLLPLGDPLALSVTGTGSGTLSYQWALNGRPIATARTRFLFVPRVQLTDAGTYTCIISNGVSTATATSIVGVFSKSQRNIFAADTADVVLSQIGSSNLNFRWFKIGNTTEFTPTTSEGFYDATRSKLTLRKASLSNLAGEFVCNPELIAQPTLTNVGERYNVSLVTSAPTFAAPTLRQGQIGKAYLETITATSASTITATGLHTGLSMDPKTGEITGFPTVSGTRTITFTATNGRGNTVRSAQLTINSLPTNLTGTMVGLLENSALINRNLGALITVTINSNGTFSGSLRISNDSLRSFTGQAILDQNNNNLINCDCSFPLGTYMANLSFVYNGALSSGRGSGYLRIRNPGETLQAPAIENANVSLFRPLSPNNADYAGRYNFHINYDSQPHPSSNQPRGVGFGSAIVLNTGGVNWAGRMADGSAYTANSFIAYDGSATLYASLNGGLGSFAAQPKIELAATLTDNLITDNSNGVRWAKNPDIMAASPRNYPAGWLPAQMNVIGSRWVAPPTGTIVMDLSPDTNSYNSKLVFSAGGLLSSDTPDMNTFITPAGIGQNYDPSTRKTTLTVTPSTGIFKGTFAMDDPMPNGVLMRRPTSYEGLIVRHPGSNPEFSAFGNFQLIQLPDPNISPMPLPSNTPILSGAVELQKLQ